MENTLASTVPIFVVLATLWVILLVIVDGCLRVYRKLQAPTVVYCPTSRAPAALALRVAGGSDLHVTRCSRWPEHAQCAETCLEQIRPGTTALVLPCIAIVGWLMVISSTAMAAEAPAPGKAAYLKYCSACHGESGTGNGVVSGLLHPRPTDLTQIAKQAGGEFPITKTMQVIDGRATIRAHGDPDMPVWGELFRAESTSAAKESEVRGKVLLIANYLRSIQAK